MDSSWDTVGEIAPPGVVAAITCPTFKTISLGSSDLPVACAGQTSVQRPHTVHASVSKSCFQVKCSMFPAPNVSRSVDVRSGNGFMAPLGRSRSAKYRFSGEVTAWRNLVTGKAMRNATNVRACNTHSQRCVPMSASAPSSLNAADIG